MMNLIQIFGEPGGYSGSFDDDGQYMGMTLKHCPFCGSDGEKQVLKADIYSGQGTYAITHSGDIFVRDKRGIWRRSRLTIREIIARSITKVSGTIRVSKSYEQY